MRDRILTALAQLVWRAPILILLTAVFLAGASIYYAATSLQLNANLDDLIAADRPYMQKYRQFLDEFGDLEYIYAVVENTGDVQRTEAAVEALTAKLRAITELPGVYCAIEPREQLRIASRAMAEQELEDLAIASGAFHALMSDHPTPRVIGDANEYLTQLIRTGANLPEDQQRRLGAAAVLLLKTIAAADENSASRREVRFLIGADRRSEYFESDTGRFYFITIIPVKDYSTLSVIEEPLRKIRAAIAETRAEFPGINIGLTGKPVLQADEMATSNSDMTKASIMAFVLCALLFIMMIGGILRPVLAMVAFGIGSAWTYGAATLLVGQLNLLSIVFMLVLVGVGLDYGVHVISRYREFRRTQSVREAIRGTMLTAVRSNLTGAMTSSIVFFMALLTTFQGLRELGLIAGVGLLLCWASMALVLPALLVLVDRKRGDAVTGIAPAATQAKPDASSNMGVLRWIVLRPTAVLVAVAVVSFGLIAAPGSLSFEQNLLNLQAQGLESIEWERRILEDSASATWFGAVSADTQQRALEVTERAKTKPSIGAVRSVFDVIGPQTVKRDELRIKLHEPIGAQTRPANAPQTQPAADWSIDDLRKAVTSLEAIVLGALRRAPAEARELARLGMELKTLIAQLEQNPSIRFAIDQTVHGIGQSLRLLLEGDQLDLRSALPDALRQQSISPSGRYLIMLHPKDDVWEYEPMSRFIREMREVDPNVTGAPITHFESLDEMLRSFVIMSILALLAIICIVGLDFRRISDVALAILPLLLGLAWTVELMGLLGVSFNLANFFSVPILIGLGVDSSVHILHRYHEGGPTRFSLGATRRAVILSSLTTIIGFGSLIIAHHRGLRSLGIVMAVGSTACMLASVIVLPALLAWLESRKSGRKDR